MSVAHLALAERLVKFVLQPSSSTGAGMLDLVLRIIAMAASRTILVVVWSKLGLSALPSHSLALAGPLVAKWSSFEHRPSGAS
jgi:hypothetical protein